MSSNRQAKNETISDYDRIKHLTEFLRRISNIDHGKFYVCRALFKNEKEPSLEGLFSRSEELAKKAVELDREGVILRKKNSRGKWEDVAVHPSGIYLVPNPVVYKMTSLRFSEINSFLKMEKQADDIEIMSREHIYIDIDAKKSSGVKDSSSTEEERLASVDMAKEIQGRLLDFGILNTALISSGNGSHVYVSVDLPCYEGSEWIDETTQTKIQSFLKSLHALYKQDPRGEVDLKVHNASRLMRLPYTTARKGQDMQPGHPLYIEGVSDLRPYRISEPILVPKEYKETKTSIDMIEAFIEAHPSEEEEPEKKTKKVERIYKLKKTKDTSSLDEKMREDLSWVYEVLSRLPISVIEDRDKWLAIGTDLKTLFGDSGYDAWYAWTSQHPKYAQNAYDKDLKDWNGLYTIEDSKAFAHLTTMINDHIKGWSFFEWYDQKHPKTTESGRGGARERRPPTPVSVQTTPVIEESDEQCFNEQEDTIEEEAGQVKTALLDLVLKNRPEFLDANNMMMIMMAVYNQLNLVHAPIVAFGKLMVCNPHTKLWEVFTEREISRIMTDWIGKVEIPSSDDGVKMFKGTNLAPSKLLKELMHMCDVPLAGDADTRCAIVLSDKIIRVDFSIPDIITEDATPESYSFHGYKFSIDDVKKSKSDRWNNYLYEMFSNSADQKESVEYLKRWVSMAVFGMATKMQAPILILRGAKGTGKSTLGKIISMLMPPNTCCTIPLEKWGHEYYRAALSNQLLNYIPEISRDEYITSLDMVKAIPFGEGVTARFPAEKQFTLHPRAAHLLCGNHLPNMKRPDPATLARFSHLFVSRTPIRGTSEDNKSFAEELVRDELPGIILDLSKACKRLLIDYRYKTKGTSSGLPILNSNETVVNLWSQQTNVIVEWIVDAISFDDTLSANKSESLSDLYRDFHAWCIDSGYKVVNKRHFKQCLEEEGISLQRSHHQDRVVGAQFRPSYIRMNQLKK